MIYDTFIYAGEQSLLLRRISQLISSVDFFVIVESAMTFSGRSRKVDVNFRNKILDEYGLKVRWIILEELYGENAWQREAFQRRAIMNGLSDVSPNDVIMLSDVDEIPNQNFLQRVLELGQVDVLIARMRLFRYCPHFESPEKICGSIAIRGSQNKLDLQKLRMRVVRYWSEYESKIVEDAGNHYTSFLTSKLYRQKIKNFSHTELDVFPFNNRLFLFLILKLGISIEGNEILRLVENNELNELDFSCVSRHNHDKLRVKLASLVQPYIKNLFKMKIGELSAPL